LKLEKVNPAVQSTRRGSVIGSRKSNVENIKHDRTAVNSRFLARGIRPSGVYNYIDNGQVWLREPLGARQRSWLESRSECHVDDRPAQFDPRYRQRLQIRQPPPEVLKWIAEQPGAYVNYLELALDLVFATEQDKDEAEAFIRKHLVKNHRGKQEIQQQGGTTTMYLASPEAANNIVTYGDQECRITGEINCLHIEWRKRGAAALRQEGITAKNLNDIDHRGFWQRKLLLYAINPTKLGREYRKVYEGRRHRRRDQVINCGKFTYNVEKRIGQTIIKAIGVNKGIESVQAVVDAYRGKKLNVRKSPERIEVSNLLPRREERKIASEVETTGLGVL
jgi:hypothetical protein